VNFPDMFTVGEAYQEANEVTEVKLKDLKKGETPKAPDVETLLLPKVFVGLSRINVQPVSGLDFNVSAKNVNSKSFEMTVPLQATSVIDE
jgi:hypothetical protein